MEELKVIGSPGAPGSPGAAGTVGQQVTLGVSEPSGGGDGDIYFVNVGDALDLYTKESGNWVLKFQFQAVPA